MKHLPVTHKLFVERREEVFAYLRFLRAALAWDSAICFPHQRRRFEFSTNKELTHTLKANTYLLLYNVVEATLTQAMEEIHKAILASGADLDQLHPQLFLQVLRRFQLSKTISDVTNTHTPSGRSLIEFWLNDYKKQDEANKNYLFSGNLDGRKICEIGVRYGFASGNEAADAHLRHRSLNTAKNHRNMLAHGESSFRDCGRNLVQNEIEGDAVNLLRCLRAFIRTVDSYLGARRYLIPGTP